MPLHVRILAGRLDGAVGSHLYHNQLARRLAARGHRVSVIGFTSDPELGRFVEITQIPNQHYERTPLLWRVASWRRWRQCGRIVCKVPLDAPDVTIGGEHLLIKSHFSRFPDSPWIYLPHSMTVTEEIRYYRMPRMQQLATMHLYRRLQRWALTHSSCVVRFTERACRFLDLAYPGARARFVVNPVGVEVPQAARRASSDPTPNLLIVGQLIRRKGIDIALSALSEMTDLPWRLNIVGDGDLRETLQRQVSSAGLATRVFFAGQVSDPSPWYTQSHLLLFPSRSESLGLVLLEAMAFGLPAIAFRADGSRFANVNEEIIENGKTGFLVANEREFRDMLRTAIGMPERLAHMGQNARAAVSVRYSWARHLERYEELFADLTGS